MPGDDGGTSDAAAGSSAGALTFIAYVIFPTLAVVTAVFGVVLATRENLAGSLLFLALLQLWLIGGIVAHIRRRRLTARSTDETS